MPPVSEVGKKILKNLGLLLGEMFALTWPLGYKTCSAQPRLKFILLINANDLLATLIVGI